MGRFGRVVFSCIVLLCVRVLAQQVQDCNLIGELKVVKQGLPNKRIEVNLESRGARIASSYSDDEGKFSFGGLQPGPYRVVINDDEFQPVNENVAINALMDCMSVVVVSLIPKKDVVRGSAPPSQPGANPHMLDGSAESRKDQPMPGSNPHLTDASVYMQRVPKPARKEFEKGLNADREGEVDAGIRHYQKALDIAPEFYAARNNLGADFLNKSQFYEAREQFEKVIQTNPSDANAYFNLGNLFLITKQYDLSGQWLEKGLSRQPDSSFGHFLQGSLYARQGKIDAAEAALKRCLELDRFMSKAHLALVNLYLQQQRKGDAIEELRVFLKDSPGDPLAPKARAVLAKLGGQPAQ